MHRISFALLALGLALGGTAGAAHAEDGSDSGVFVKAGGGLGTVFGGDADLIADGERVGGDASFGLGWAANTAIGYRLDNWALEFEVAYRRTAIDEVKLADGSRLATDGDFASLTLMGNGTYRFDLGSPIRPYVGAGFGLLEEVDIDLESGDRPEESFSDSTLAWQVMAGVDYEIGHGLSVLAELRYFSAIGLDLKSEDRPNASLEADYSGLTGGLALVYQF